ncbi:MAG: ribE [Myxococcaceae bacterium]|nr:ribE [Myxococcaceae bacterium]
MFTGLIQDVGAVERISSGAMTEVWIASHFPADLQLGESIACDGCCLTVVELKGATFRVQASPETLRHTTLGLWHPGTAVNLERALKVGDRMGGHWVQGHVDAVGEILESRAEAGSWLMAVSLPPQLAAIFIDKGSVALDGISLTVNRVEADRFWVALIPETVARTSLKAKGVGGKVNLEGDLVGKYVARLHGLRSGLTEEQLRAAGF